MKQRNIGIDILKCIAAILIVNSHMDLLYPNKAFATGGGIGDVLFFFCSGFTLFLKPMGRFDNWYKKRKPAGPCRNNRTASFSRPGNRL